VWLAIHVEYTYTIVRINTQYNVLVNQVFANPMSVFVLREFRSLDNTTVCILILSCCLYYLMRSSASFQGASWTCFLKFFFICISASQDVSCWGAETNSTCSGWACSSFGLYKYDWVRLKQCSVLCFCFCWLVQGYREHIRLGMWQVIGRWQTGWP